MNKISIDSAEHYAWGDGCDGWILLDGDDLTVVEECVPAGKSLCVCQYAVPPQSGRNPHTAMRRQRRRRGRRIAFGGASVSAGAFSVVEGADIDRVEIACRVRLVASAC